MAMVGGGGGGTRRDPGVPKWQGREKGMTEEGREGDAGSGTPVEEESQSGWAYMAESGGRKGGGK